MNVPFLPSGPHLYLLSIFATAATSSGWIGMSMHTSVNYSRMGSINRYSPPMEEMGQPHSSPQPTLLEYSSCKDQGTDKGCLC